MICIQLLRVVYYGISWFATSLLADKAVANALVAFAQQNVTLVTDAYSLLGSVFLFAIR